MPPRGSPRVGPSTTAPAPPDAPASETELGPGARLTLRATRAAPVSAGSASGSGSARGSTRGSPALPPGPSTAALGNGDKAWDASSTLAVPMPSSDPSFPPSAASSPLTPASAPSPIANTKGKGKAVERRVLPARIRRVAGGAEGIRELEEMVVDWLERYGEWPALSIRPLKGLTDLKRIAVQAHQSPCRSHSRRSHAPSSLPSHSTLRPRKRQRRQTLPRPARRSCRGKSRHRRGYS